MIRRALRWLLGSTEQRDLHVHVHVYLQPSGSGTVQNVSVTSQTTKRTTQQQDDITGTEIAEVILAGGITKAVDKSSEAAITQDETSGVDDQLAALRRLRG